MRLLHRSETGELSLTKNLVGDDLTPSYAILSHTWGPDNEEVTFEDMTNGTGKDKSGYAKIRYCGEQARQDGLQYFWIDTCCIDKSSSSELSEAINTMYHWYEKAEVCYALLSDFDGTSMEEGTALAACRWFTRGWCLQELIAPKNVEFFNSQWNFLGTRAQMAPLLSKITLIDLEVLVDNKVMEFFPVAHKMSWAARRETTREEDMAYCLLGIFDVNMPMLYGEGMKAFERLQEEIIKSSNDLSIFSFQSESVQTGTQSPSGSDPPFRNLLATSPRQFLGSEGLHQTRPNVQWSQAFTLTNKGLHFPQTELQIDARRGFYSIPLHCRTYDSNSASMYLRKVGAGLFARCNDDRSVALDNISDSSASGTIRTELEEVYVIRKVTPRILHQLDRAEDFAIHVESHGFDLSAALQVLRRTPSSNRWDVSRMQFLTNGEDSFEGYWKVFPGLVQGHSKDEDEHHGITEHFYLICGFEYSSPAFQSRAWVRLVSSDQWRILERTYGMITSIRAKDGTTGFDTELTKDQITLHGKTSSLQITAAIILETKEDRPRYQLTLRFAKGLSSQ